MENRVTDAIVMSTLPYDKTIFNPKWFCKLSKAELEELYDTLYGWTTLSIYCNEYKKKCRNAMKEIERLIKKKG